MCSSKTILQSVTEKTFFEQLMLAGHPGTPALDQNQQYADPMIRAMFMGFVMGHVAGFAQGAHALREVFDTGFKKGADVAIFSPAEVGTSEGLRATDKLLDASLADLQSLRVSDTGQEFGMQIAQFQHLIHGLLNQPAFEPQKLAS